ncbi:hypothetical protein N8J89_31145 [Crossiella sp. CA-258035]|uniref:hypothetical protein n=1 Tax=Crossiella sp. CA-258035 TaxID=2981138 RepID=UPI0024BC301A|nr:hypothetical protein [Crossiella sp. CA-258035]WHT17552.1 hypothetical protein N8J89_31145 [Crossiella sp. CA-258035]
MNSVHVPQLSALTKAVDNVTNATIRLAEEQEKIQHSVNVVHTKQDQAARQLSVLQTAFDQLAREQLRQHYLQVAHTKIVEVRQTLDTDYGHFREVRRLATGTLQALDVGIVSHGTMRNLTEELMLLTPGYWLAPALIALAAWIRNDEELAGKALQEAVRRDNDKASLFFALVLRRHHRDEATSRWLRQYVARQDPGQLSREFTVIIDAVSTGALGHAAKPIVLDQMREWYDRLNADQAIVDRQVDRWAQVIDAERRPVDPRYTVLQTISPTWPQLKALYEGATVHGAAEEMFRRIFTGPIPLDNGLRERVDGILDSLVTGYDIEEAPLRQEEAGLQAVIDAEGDKDAAAKAMRLVDPLHEQTTDFLTLISNSALQPDKAGVSLGTRRSSIALARDWIVQGAGRLEAANVASEPKAVTLTLEGWTAQVDGRTDEPALVAGLARHIDDETERAVAAVRFTGSPLYAAIGTGVLTLVALLTALNGGVGFAVFCLLVAAGLGGWSMWQVRGFPARRAEIRAQGEQRKVVATATLRGGIAELVDLRGEWQRELAGAERFRQYMGRLEGAAFAPSTPGERRGA